MVWVSAGSSINTRPAAPGHSRRRVVGERWNRTSNQTSLSSALDQTLSSSPSPVVCPAPSVVAASDVAAGGWRARCDAAVRPLKRTHAAAANRHRSTRLYEHATP